MTFLDHPLPANPEFERVALGACLLMPVLVPDVINGLKAETFTSVRHRQLFTAIAELHRDGVEVEPLNLFNAVKRVPGSTWTPTEVANLAIGLPYFSNIDGYIKTLQDVAFSRKSVLTLSNLAERIATEQLPAEQAQTLIKTAFDDIDIISAASGFQGIGAVIDEDVVPYLADVQSGKVQTIHIGIAPVDAVTGGHKKGEVVIVAAKTGRGKSAFAIQTARHIATTQCPVLFASYEMANRENIFRMLTQDSGYPAKMFHNKMRTEELDRINEMLDGLRKIPLRITDTCPSIQDLGRWAKHAVRKHQAGVLYVDYLQLIGAGDNVSLTSRANEVAYVSRTLKKIAMTEKIVIFALAQFNRQANFADESELHHLGESGQIEKDASVVIFLKVADQDAFDWKKPRDTEIHFKKGRDSPVGVVSNLEFHGSRLRFEVKKDAGRHWNSE